MLQLGCCLRLPTFQHVTPLLKNLHWLPIHYQARSTVIVLVHEVLIDLGPGYLRECLLPYQPAWSLRSSEGMLLVVPHRPIHIETTKGRAFSVVAPPTMEFRTSGGQAGTNFVFLLAPPENDIVPGSLSLMTSHGSQFTFHFVFKYLF